MNEPNPRSFPTPGFFFLKHRAWWRYRKRKFYNPIGLCQRCGRPSSPHQKYCLACISLFRWQGLEALDYQDTLASIRSDWHL